MNVLATIGIRLLEILFFAGWVGSAVVLLLTSIEDVETILGRGQPGPIDRPKSTG